MANIEIIRVYDLPCPAPHNCFLTDRLWPRGVSKERLAGVQWIKEVAPTNELRQWFHQNREQWPEFECRYYEELKNNSAWVTLIRLLKQGETLYLVFSSKNIQQNQAIVLRKFLLEQLTIDSDKMHRQADE